MRLWSVWETPPMTRRMPAGGPGPDSQGDGPRPIHGREPAGSGRALAAAEEALENGETEELLAAWEKLEKALQIWL